MVFVTSVPVPTFKSLVTSLSGGGPTGTGTFGAPFGKGPFIATHGLPFADARAAAVVGVATVVAVLAVLDLLSSRLPITTATTATIAMRTTKATSPPMRRRRRV